MVGALTVPALQFSVVLLLPASYSTLSLKPSLREWGGTTKALSAMGVPCCLQSGRQTAAEGAEI